MGHVQVDSVQIFASKRYCYFGGLCIALTGLQTPSDQLAAARADRLQPLHYCQEKDCVRSITSDWHLVEGR